MAETYMTDLRKEWSANEAACVTEVPLKQVHRIIDAGLLGDAAESRNGARTVLGAGLVGLKLAYQMGPILTPEGRRRLIQRLLDKPATEAVYDEPLSIDVRLMMNDVHRRIAMLEQAREMVEIDDNVLGGTPCFKGTRIPIHDIAAMLANGDTVAVLQLAYPRLTEVQINAAPVYSLAYPRRGRRRKASPWHRQASLSSTVFRCLPMDSIT